jgi:hypothetical protein
MSFNPGKTEILFFSNTGNIDNIEFSFNGKSIPLSTSHKHLGVILSQNAKWNESMLPVLEKNKISVFSELNDISHLLDQAFSSSRS